jgi:hypothetical protein
MPVQELNSAIAAARESTEATVIGAILDNVVIVMSFGFCLPPTQISARRN